MNFEALMPLAASWFSGRMLDDGYCGDARAFALPGDWTQASAEVLETAVAQALTALTGDLAAASLGRYYDRGSSYAGTMFLDAQPNDPFSIQAADLYAVTTLSIRLDARHGRLLLDDGEVRVGVSRQLRGLEPHLPLTDLQSGEGGSAETLLRMYELQRTFRGLLSGGSQRWVTAAKLCARKRPRLFPVRDNLVCEYLGGGRPLKSGDGWPGDFSIDIQVYAHLLTHAKVIAALSWLRNELASLTDLRLDEEDLRLLDSALWMAASQRQPRA